ncbi:MAG: hypothetical protein COA73_05905 [Candidatus Hydrogenedentota bacterium]|nr:MAG: hypothetical protein COA73_05905 [Candidatus Hydrogenedentota bacterium]
MSLWHIAWNYLWNRWLTTSLTILSVALAVALITAILTLRDETKARFEEEQNAFDIVVGPGSPLQLTLNAVYYLDRPTGSMAYSDYLKLKAHEDVIHAFPVGLGDTVAGYRIVGTEKEMFEYAWENDVTRELRYPFQLADGKFFDGPMQAVVGYQVAKAIGFKVGDEFESIHGNIDMGELGEFDHSDSLYTVVGVLKASGTSNDRAVFVDLTSIWAGHEMHGEAPEAGAEDERMVSAVLVDLYSAALRFSYMDWVMHEIKLTAAMPINQIMRLYNQILGPAIMIMMAIGYIIVLISALSIMIGLYLSIIQRKRDLAIMRALGASAYEIFGAVMIEAFLVTMMGIAAGVVLGKATAYGLGLYMGSNYGFAINSFSVSDQELGFYAIVAIVGLVAGIIPAWQAYRTDVASDLQAN